MDIRQILENTKHIYHKQKQDVATLYSHCSSRRKKKLILLSFCLMVNLLLFLLVCYKNELYFATNDDYRMRLIVSGSYTGDPSLYTVFIKTFISRPLSWLYSINNIIPWYGLAILASLYFTTSYLFYTILNKCKAKYTYISCFGLYIIFFIFLIQKHIRESQFTLVAAFFGLCAILAILQILEYLEGKKRGIYSYFLHCLVFWISCLMAFSYRDMIFVITLPLLFFITLVKILRGKINPKKLLPIFSVCCVLLLLIWLDNYIFTSSKEDDQAFSAFTEKRSELYDYKLIPKPYSTYRTFYESLNISEDEFKALETRTLDVSEDLNTTTYEQITAKGSEIYGTNILSRFYEGFQQSIDNLFTDLVRFSTLFLAMLFCIIMLIGKHIKEFTVDSKILINGSILYVFCGIITFVAMGRIMPRLTDTLILYASGILSLVIANHLSTCKQNLTRVKFERNNIILFLRNLSTFGLLAIVFVCLIISNQSQLSTQEKNLINNSARLTRLNGYAKQHLENFYFYNSHDFIASSAPLLEEQVGIVNTESLGNWYAKSPEYYKRNESYGFHSAIEGIAQNDNVYYVCTGKNANSIRSLLKEQYHKILVKTDVIKDETGQAIYIYKIADAIS